MNSFHNHRRFSNPILILISSFAIVNLTFAQKVNPVIPSYGGIHEIPEATVLPDYEGPYNIVVDIYSGAQDPSQISPGLNNVARMLNLHAVGGAAPDKMNVVLAVHAGATYALLTDTAYQKRYDTANPNRLLIKELGEAGVKIAICGQSMKGRNVAPGELLEEVEIATSMLTTVSTYQLRGYAFFKF